MTFQKKKKILPGTPQKQKHSEVLTLMSKVGHKMSLWFQRFYKWMKYDGLPF